MVIDTVKKGRKTLYNAELKENKLQVQTLI